MSLTVVVQAQTDRLYIRHLNPDTLAEITVSSGTISIYTGTTALVSSAAVSGTGGSNPYYERTWDTATFPLGKYRAEWALTDGSAVTRTEIHFFEVVKKPFRCPVGESDFISRYPYLQNQLPSGTTVASFLSTAWDEITDRLYARLGCYPGNVPYVETLKRVAEYWTVADIYRNIARGEDSDMEQSKVFRKMAEDCLETALSFMHVDADDDNVVTDSEASTWSGGELRR